MKITSKLIISCIIVSLLCMLAFEFALNRYLYSDKEEILNKISELEKIIQINK